MDIFFLVMKNITAVRIVKTIKPTTSSKKGAGLNEKAITARHASAPILVNERMKNRLRFGDRIRNHSRPRNKYMDKPIFSIFSFLTIDIK